MHGEHEGNYSRNLDSLEDEARKYSRENYGSSDSGQFPAANGTAFSRYRQEGDAGFGYYGDDAEDLVSPTEVIPAVRSSAVYDDGDTWSAYPEGGYDDYGDGFAYHETAPQAGGNTGSRRNGGGDVTSRPTGTARKRHPVRNVFLVVLAIIAAIGLFNAASCAMRDERGWADEYAGTWQMKAVGNSNSPILSFGASLFASSSTDLGKQMIIGITGDGAQMQSFGSVKDYTFSFDKGHFKMTPVDGDGGMEGDLRFGYLLVDDNAGNLIIYERTSKEYSPVSPETAGFDADGLVSTLKDLAGQAGVDPSIFDSIDTQALGEQLQGVSPETIQELIGSVDVGQLANGNLEGAIDMSSPAVNEIIESVDPSSVVDVDSAVEQVDSLMEDLNIDPNATPEDLTEMVNDLWNSTAPSGD